MTNEELTARLNKPRFPRSSNYDGRWVLDNMMGPHVLWLAEHLSEVLGFTPGMRVLDLGCGKAISSIFLAREFGVQVVAADLWIEPTRECAAHRGGRGRGPGRARLCRSPCLAVRARFLRRDRQLRCLPVFRNRRSVSRHHLEVPEARRTYRHRLCRAFRGRSPRCPQTSSPGGSGISAAFIRRIGGVTTGTRPAWSTSRPPTGWTTATPCGWTGAASPHNCRRIPQEIFSGWRCHARGRPRKALRLHAGGGPQDVKLCVNSTFPDSRLALALRQAQGEGQPRSSSWSARCRAADVEGWMAGFATLSHAELHRKDASRNADGREAFRLWHARIEAIGAVRANPLHRDRAHHLGMDGADIFVTCRAW